MKTEALKFLFKAQKEEAMQDWMTLLKFPSISSDPNQKKATRECANWLLDYLNEMGFETELWETSGHPTLFAKHTKAGEDKPTLLIYNHYDVQPVDPLKKWDSPPFEPTIRDGEMYARGA